MKGGFVLGVLLFPSTPNSFTEKIAGRLPSVGECSSQNKEDLVLKKKRKFRGPCLFVFQFILKTTGWYTTCISLHKTLSYKSLACYTFDVQVSEHSKESMCFKIITVTWLSLFVTLWGVDKHSSCCELSTATETTAARHYGSVCNLLPVGISNI